MWTEIQNGYFVINNFLTHIKYIQLPKPLITFF